MSAWWLLMVPGALLYAAGALVTFGWMTCGGMYRQPSDYVWAAVWPVSPLRGVGWAIRRKFTTLIGGKPRFAVLTVPAQRPDLWLMKIGEEMAFRWEEVTTTDTASQAPVTKDQVDAAETAMNRYYSRGGYISSRAAFLHGLRAAGIPTTEETPNE